MEIVKNAKGISLPAIGATKSAVKAAGKAQGTAKANPAPKAKDAPKGTPKATVKAEGKIAALVYLDLPKGTERFTSNSGIEWVRTPKTGAFKRWFQLAPKGTEETGIHACKKNADGTFTLTIERARVPYRELKGAMREMK